MSEHIIDQGAGLPEVSVELAHEWGVMATQQPGSMSQNLARQAIAWAAPILRQQGADAELEAVEHYIGSDGKWFANPMPRLAELRAARRPKPPSLAEQATTELDRAVMRGDCVATTDAMPAIRAALERLRDLERGDGN